MKVTTKTLAQHEVILIKFEGKDTSVTINGSGDAIVLNGIESEEFNLFTQGRNRPDLIQTGCNMIHNQEPSRLDHLSNYLELLFQAQRSEHDVHKEITEALQLYRKAAGI